MLDEPPNHPDPESIKWAVEFLESFGGTFLVVAHDRYFLDRVATSILELCDDNFFSHAANCFPLCSLAKRAGVLSNLACLTSRL